ncbi:MAG: hypothetical protein WA949_22805 [Phormidesmis sp.]
MIALLSSFIRLAESIKCAVSQRFSTGKSLAIAGLASVLLMGMSTPAQAADVDYSKNSQGGIQSTQRYGKIQSESGGMNNFDAMDPRRSTAETSAKAQTLSDVAKRRKLEASDPFEPIREVAEDVKNRVTGAVEEADPVESVKDAARDVKNRVGNAVPGAGVGYDQNSQGGIQSTQRYGKIQSESGGMNNYSAVDPRRNITEAGTEAQTLSDVAERRKLEATDPLAPVREAVDEVKSKIAGTADAVTDNLK